MTLQRFLPLFACIGALLTSAPPAAGQPVLEHTSTRLVRGETGIADHRIEHLTPRLRSRREFSFLRAQIGRARSASAKRSSASEIGSTERFFVRDLFDQEQFYVRSARLYGQTERLSVWIDTLQETALRQAGVLDLVADSLVRYAEHGTPVWSLVPETGILPILRNHFGEIPDVDGDGRVDVLLLDIPDRFTETGGYVAGFFDPVNLIEHPFSNRRDLIYLDLFPTVFRDGQVRVQEAAATFAHEAQHLIHAGYEAELELESPFLNEGLSELAEILCGFSPRPADIYFAKPDRALLSWNYDDPYADYARASLWTLFLFEQIGAGHIRTLVQSSTTGADAYREVLRAASAAGLEEMFILWGHALLRGDAYRHPGRVSLQPQGKMLGGFPAAISADLPPLSHAFLHVPLAQEVRIEADAPARSEATALFRYPDGSNDFRTSASLRSARFSASRAHGDLTLLLSNASAEGSAEVPPVALIIEGWQSGRLRTLQYDDGAPDAFSDMASYLLVEEPGGGIGLVFRADEALWIESISAKLLFSNELQGSGLPHDAPREAIVQLFTFENGRPTAPLTPPRRIRVARPFGNLQFERVSLRDDYAVLAAVRDSFAVVLRNAEENANPFAVALDRSGSDAGLFHDAPQAQWVPMRQRQVRGASLAGFTPMIRAHAVTVEHHAVFPPGTATVEHTFEHVRLSIPWMTPLDTLRTRAVARTGSGAVWNGTAVHTEAGVTFRFPLEVGGTYTFHVSLAEAETSTTRETTVRWEMPVQHAVEIAATYPNPTSGRTTFVYHAFGDGDADVVLYDVLGREVLRHPTGPLTRGRHDEVLDLSGLASGLYLARVTNGEGPSARAATRQIIVLK